MTPQYLPCWTAVFVTKILFLNSVFFVYISWNFFPGKTQYDAYTFNTRSEATDFFQ